MAGGITQQVLDKIGDVSVSVAHIEEKMIRFDEITTDLIKKVNGNGKPGLLDRVGCIEEQHRNEAETKKAVVEVKSKRADFSSKVILILITMVVSNVGVLLFAIFKP
jgi:hypothetical protein